MTNEELIAKIKAEIDRQYDDKAYSEDRWDLGYDCACEDILSFLSTLEKECGDFPTTDEEMAKFLATHPKVEVPEKYKTPDWMFEKSEKPMNPADAMKALDEKIALVKQKGTWDGVDVDKYMDEVRGREPEKPTQEGLEEEIERVVSEYSDKVQGTRVMKPSGVEKIARHFYELGYRYGFLEGAKTQRKEDDQLVDTIYQQGIEKGKDEILDNSVIVECGVRVYPELDEEPTPWVSLYKHGINCDSLKDIPELENLGFRDDDTAIVIIKRKV